MKMSIMLTKSSEEMSVIRKNSQKESQQTAEIARKATINKTKGQILKAVRKNLQKNRKKCQWINKANPLNLRKTTIAKIQIVLFKLMNKDQGQIPILTTDQKEQQLLIGDKLLLRKARRIWMRKTMID